MRDTSSEKRMSNQKPRLLGARKMLAKKHKVVYQIFLHFGKIPYVAKFREIHIDGPSATAFVRQKALP